MTARLAVVHAPLTLLRRHLLDDEEVGHLFLAVGADDEAADE